MKICYVIESMYNSGGMERVLSVCANALSKEIDISILTLYQNGRDYFFPVEDRIRKHDLGLENVLNKKLLKSRLSNFLRSHQFDVVVSLGGIDMYYLHSIKDGSKKIVWFHFAIDIVKTWAGDNPSLARKIKAYLQSWKRIYNGKKYDKIVVLSNGDCNKWKKYTNKVICIFNPISFIPDNKSERTHKSVISVGRLEYEKGYDYLVDAWALVSKKHPDWSLDIYGEGRLKDSLQKQINNLGLNDKIILRGQSSNIEAKYPLYSIFVACSRSEGLSLVLIEASSCGLPLVSYDSPSGPREIIENGKNGYLIRKVGDVQGLAGAINILIEDEALRNRMGEAALKMVDKFYIDNISKQWIGLFESI